MNKELYENIKNKLSSLDPYYVREMLINDLKNKNSNDYFTVLYAYHEYMINNEEFSFVQTGQWLDFFKKRFNYYFEQRQNIHDNLENIIKYKNLLYIIINLCNGHIRKEVYNALEESSPLFGSNNYESVLNDLRQNLIENDIIIKPEEKKSEDNLNIQIDNINMQSETSDLDNNGKINTTTYSDDEYNVLSSNNVIQTVSITVYNILKKRLMIRRSSLVPVDYKIKNVTSDSFDKIATMNAIGLEDLINGSKIRKIIFNYVLKPYEINNIISKLKNTNKSQDVSIKI